MFVFSLNEESTLPKNFFGLLFPRRFLGRWRAAHLPNRLSLPMMAVFLCALLFLASFAHSAPARDATTLSSEDYTLATNFVRALAASRSMNNQEKKTPAPHPDVGCILGKCRRRRTCSLVQ